MKAMPIEIRDGALRLPSGVQLPPEAHLAVIVLDRADTDLDFHTMADAGGAFDFLREEPELYSDADILPGKANPHFGGKR